MCPVSQQFEINRLNSIPTGKFKNVIRLENRRPAASPSVKQVDFNQICCSEVCNEELINTFRGFRDCL